MEYVGNNSDFVIENGILRACTVRNGDVVIPAGVTAIGERAFEDCRDLTSVTIPENVAKIGSSVFKGCTTLIRITIPASAAKMNQLVFSPGKIFPSTLRRDPIPRSMHRKTKFLSWPCKEIRGVGDAAAKARQTKIH